MPDLFEIWLYLLLSKYLQLFAFYTFTLLTFSIPFSTDKIAHMYWEHWECGALLDRQADTAYALKCPVKYRAIHEKGIFRSSRRI